MTHPITEIRELERISLNRLLGHTPHNILTIINTLNVTEHDYTPPRHHVFRAIRNTAEHHNRHDPHTPIGYTEVLNELNKGGDYNIGTKDELNLIHATRNNPTGLWETQVTYTTVVKADNEQEAITAAKSELPDHLYPNVLTITSHPLRRNGNQ